MAKLVSKLIKECRNVQENYFEKAGKSFAYRSDCVEPRFKHEVSIDDFEQYKYFYSNIYIKKELYDRHLVYGGYSKLQDNRDINIRIYINKERKVFYLFDMNSKFGMMNSKGKEKDKEFYRFEIDDSVRKGFYYYMKDIILETKSDLPSDVAIAVAEEGGNVATIHKYTCGNKAVYSCDGTLLKGNIDEKNIM